MEQLLKLGLYIAGGAQFLLFIGSLAIPHCLKWSEHTAQLIPLMRQMFFTYAVYILGSHLFFAIITFFFADELMKGSPLGNTLLVFMGLWWSGRIVCQFFYFNRDDIPETPFNKVAETLLVTMFFGLVTVYWGTLIWNIR